MEWLNYHHLLYFWTVVREGSIAAAGRALGVGRPSVSMQLKSLEQAFGQPLFERRGRRLEPTETGRLVFWYADDIFRTGRELLDAVRGRPLAGLRPLRVGLADVLAKTVAFRLLDAVLQDGGWRLEVGEAPPRELLARLAVHELDVVLSDAPVPPGLDVRAYSHLLGESSTTLFAAPELARRLAPGFPGSLQGAPMLMPGPEAAARRALEAWLGERELRPLVVGEFEDSALLNNFGRAGRGVFAAPTAVAEEVRHHFDVRALGELPEVRERFYALSGERKIRHPAVDLVRAAAAEVLGAP